MTSAFRTIVVTTSAILVALALIFAPVAHATEATACEGAGGTPTAGGGCNFGTDSPVLTGNNSVFKTVTNILLFVTGAIAVIFLVVNGIRFITANGDAQAIQSAKNGVLYSIVGIVVAFMAYALVSFVAGQIADPDTAEDTAPAPTCPPGPC